MSDIHARQYVRTHVRLDGRTSVTIRTPSEHLPAITLDDVSEHIPELVPELITEHCLSARVRQLLSG